MPIKFTCPHCKKGLKVPDQLAGKKGACPVCKKALTIPRPTPAPGGGLAPPAPEPTPAPAASSADADAEAAALLADKPEEAAVQEPKTVDFTCPYCETELHLDASLAGKRH